MPAPNVWIFYKEEHLLSQEKNHYAYDHGSPYPNQAKTTFLHMWIVAGRRGANPQPFDSKLQH